jgi:hypothetical protein
MLAELVYGAFWASRPCRSADFSAQSNEEKMHDHTFLPWDQRLESAAGSLIVPAFSEGYPVDNPKYVCVNWHNLFVPGEK